MRKILFYIFIIALAAMINGCIISKTPSGDVSMNAGEKMTFSVKVLPSDAIYSWYLDGHLLANTTSSYEYTAIPGGHMLVVRATHPTSVDTYAWLISTSSPPVANAGPDQTVYAGTTVTLDGSGSTDPDGDITSYLWTQTSGPAVTLADANTAIAHFSAAVAAGSVLVFELTVTDSKGLQGEDTCVVTVPVSPINDLLSSLVVIPAGSFQMGSDEEDYAQPVHIVTLQSFKIGAFEVTQDQYLAVMGVNPSDNQGPGHETCPVEMVSQLDALAFCDALSALTGRTFTLPSESQWEYACRAGSTTRFSFGDDAALLEGYGWYNENADETQPVGTKLPNAFGLYDMHGNVWEWCLDSFHFDYVGAPDDGSAWEPDTGLYFMLRGGSLLPAQYCRSAYRAMNENTVQAPNFGFRIVSAD